MPNLDEDVLSRRQPDAPSGRVRRLSGPVAFVEDKPADFVEVASLLQASARLNHWTNFGPVWALLKAHIEAALDLPPERVALPCASGTHALMAAAALAEREAERRWVVSAYGFRATVIGPFADALVIDSDRHGVIDLAELEREAGNYTGIVATNPFGLLGDLEELVRFARKHGKVLIIDNAAAFVGFTRRDHAGVFECFSLHHTKPYGFGEGGCLVVDRDLEDRARSALDFGYRMEWSGGHRGMSNGKLSDPAAAFILARQKRDNEWAPGYRRQFARILAIAREEGFTLVVDEAAIGRGVYGNLPLLATSAVTEEQLKNERIVFRKYYKPLAPREAAADLYARVVNVPIHPGMEAIDDRNIRALLAGIRSGGRR